MATATAGNEMVTEYAEKKFRETKRALTYSGIASGALFLMVLIALILRLFGAKSGASGDTILAGLAVPVAAFAAGTLLGLLFAIPQVGANGGTTQPAEGEATIDDAAAVTRRVTHNDSLVRVSQWLTTVIVGASLVQLNELMKVLDQAGRAVSLALIGCGAGCPDDSLSVGVIGTALLLAFAIGGFLVGYLWTRVIFYIELFELERSLDPAAAAVAARAKSEGNVQRLADEIESGEALTLPPELTLGAANLEGRVDAATIDSNDPMKGQFGGSSESGGYKLQAEIRKSNVPNFFSVKLLVARTGNDTSATEAEFYLHPTFPRSVVRKKMNRYGNATLAILAWGAFTVGVRLDNGVKLELDLSEVADAPPLFRER